MNQKILLVIGILAIIISGMIVLGNITQQSTTENKVFSSELKSNIQIIETEDAILASFEDDKKDDCEEYCYIDLSVDPTPIILVPETSDEAYAQSLKMQFIDGVKKASTEGLLDGCTFIRAPKPDQIRIVKVPMVSAPDIDGYKIIPGPTGSKLDDVQITDPYAILKTTGKIMGTNLAKENNDGSKNLMLSAARYEQKKDGKTIVGSTISQPFKKDLMFYISTGTRDYDPNSPAEDTVAHEMAHMLTYQAQAIEKGALNALRSPFDQHSVDSAGTTIGKDNILAYSKQANAKTTLTEQQKKDFKKVCEKNPNKVKNLDKEDLVPACGDDICIEGETSITCPVDCVTSDGKDKCQWKSGKMDNSDGSKVCGGVCPDPRVTCGMKGSPSGHDCGCYYYCGDGIVSGGKGEECEQASDCPTVPGKTASCTGCKCIYKGEP